MRMGPATTTCWANPVGASRVQAFEQREGGRAQRVHQKPLSTDDCYLKERCTFDRNWVGDRSDPVARSAVVRLGGALIISHPLP